MALRQVVVSDISGQVIAEHDVARVTVVGHPAVHGAVEMDMSIDEAAKIQDVELNLVHLTVHGPENVRREVLVDSSSLCSMFEGVDVVEVIQRARRADAKKPLQSRRRGRSRARRDQPDYSDLRFAGNVHRGRVTEAEAATVRQHLSEINDRLKREGRPTIDPEDLVAKKRYRFPLEDDPGAAVRATP